MEEGGKDESAASGNADLSQLLDSCLDDFNKPLPQKVQSTSQPTKLTSAESSESKPLDGEAWSEEFKQFSDAMQGAIGNESELNEIQKLMDSLSQEGISPIDETFAATFVDTFRELTEQTQNIPETTDPEELAHLLSSLGMGSSNIGDVDSLPDIMPLVQNVMNKMMSKEVLYPSLKDIVEKYPGWLCENKSTLKEEEYEIYTKQYQMMKKICDEFESDCDSSEEGKKKQFEKVLQLMQKVQSYGNPPKELVSGIPFYDQGNLHVPGMPQQCAIM